MSRPQWTGKKWTAHLPTREITLTSEDLSRWRDIYVGDDGLASRMSQLIWFDMYVLNEEYGINPLDVMQSIGDVEKGEPETVGVKAATIFRKPPLRGLWHKHYFSARFVPANITAQLGDKGLEKLIDEVMNTGEPRITKEMISTLAHRIAHGTLEDRNAAGRLTGEWIIFAKNNGVNRYLCLNTHNTGDQSIYDRIRAHCVLDFPDIMTWFQGP